MTFTRSVNDASEDGIMSLRLLNATLKYATDGGYALTFICKLPVNWLLLTSTRTIASLPHDDGRAPLKLLSYKSRLLSERQSYGSGPERRFELTARYSSVTSGLSMAEDRVPSNRLLSKYRYIKADKKPSSLGNVPVKKFELSSR